MQIYDLYKTLIMVDSFKFWSLTKIHTMSWIWGTKYYNKADNTFEEYLTRHITVVTELSI